MNYSGKNIFSFSAFSFSNDFVVNNFTTDNRQQTTDNNNIFNFERYFEVCKSKNLFSNTCSGIFSVAKYFLRNGKLFFRTDAANLRNQISNFRTLFGKLRTPFGNFRTPFGNFRCLIGNFRTQFGIQFPHKNKSKFNF